MSRQRSATRRLDSLLSAFERTFFSASDEDVLKDNREGARAAAEVRALLAGHLRDLHLEADQKGRQSTKQSRKVLPSVPGDLVSRIGLLKTLLYSRPELSPTISAVFSSGRKPSKRMVDKVTKELVRLGVLKDKED